MGCLKSPLDETPAVSPPARRNILAAASALAAFGLASRAVAPDPELIDYLLVQTAEGMTFNTSTSTLSLVGVSPITLFFADRPERVAGNMKSTAFIPFWSHGKDSLFRNPPSADVSIVDGDTMRQVVGELLDPILECDVLHYRVNILQGDMPPKGA